MPFFLTNFADTEMVNLHKEDDCRVQPPIVCKIGFIPFNVNAT